MSILNSDKVMKVEFDPGIRDYLIAPDLPKGRYINLLKLIIRESNQVIDN